MKFLDELAKILKSDERFIGEDNQIIKTKVSDAARGTDGLLLKSLLENELMRNTLFTKVDDIYVFDKNKFVWILESKEFLPDSYTQYKNKIGLVDNKNNLISQKQDVALVWPYKDCVLEGGQTKEDQKRDEIFYNETLAPDQVNRLLAPKVLGNAKRYTEEGVEENIKFKDDDNLIIKGNNLLALSSLLEKYEGKIQLIYIDPPYNTGSDSFYYNDNFNHSTWLTFMKNRLMLAKELLKDGGGIFVQCDDNEQAYLKILMDEIFGRYNFVNTIAIKMSEATSNKMTHANKRLPKLKEYILFYKKGDIKINTEKILVPIDKWGVNYKIVIDGISESEINRLRELINLENATEDDVYEFNDIAKKIEMKTFNEFVDGWDNLDKSEQLSWKYNNANRILRIASSSSAKKTLDKIKESMNQDYFAIKTKRNKLYFVTKNYNDAAKDPNIKFLFASDYLTQNPCDFWEDIKTTRVDVEGDVEFLNGKKPEKLLERVISMLSNEGDIILDYHLGSGTTTAVAHKMNRKYIGVEQMEYMNSKTLIRMNNVIHGDKSGVSKKINWQGGGSFVYCELLEDNEELVEELEKAIDAQTVKDVLNIAIEHGKIIPAVLPSDLRGTEDSFDELSLDDQKKLVMELLDKNKLYINLSDLEDENFNISESDKAFTRSFYGMEDI